MTRSYYQILGVSQDSPEKEIKRAYHRLAREMHPDKAASPDEVKRLEDEFALISTAYNTLKDPVKRQDYDKTLQDKSSETSKFRPVTPMTPGGAQATQSATQKGKTDTARPGERTQVMEHGRVQIAKKALAKGIQLYQTGDFAKAIEFFEAAIKNNDREAPVFMWNARALMRARKSFTRAVEMAQKAVDLDPYNVDFKMVLGEVYEMAGTYSMAQKIYEEVLKWEPTNAAAMKKLSDLATVKRRGGDKSVFSKFLGRFKKG
ncbi:MAG: DnaJ domain-containing protein [bacterium]